ncbi:Hypothetical protein GSB_24537 [Giardia duodenalis]|uniref:Spindle pole protein, putative n=2 Tax=Giardia intestinalis TaxID=5741 RepID=C6LRP0_GIAIB|nr:Spindle pole protein, putative [Giardia intestinalis ATCC 50581]ESU41596.1 Hypothetical protein GSB_24537 [Giardia intestinalis]
MADFDILGSLGVNIPNEPIHPISRSTELKVVAPREKPPAVSPAVKAHDLKLDDLVPSGSRTPVSSSSTKRSPHTSGLRASVGSAGSSRIQAKAAPYVTTAQLATMSLDEKKDLLAAMKDYDEQKALHCRHNDPMKSGVIVDRCEDAWCPTCINELNMAKRKLLEEMERDKERKTAKQQADDAKKLADIEAALERLQRKRMQDDAQAAIRASEKARQAAREAAQRELEREKEQQEAARREAQEYAQRELERQRAFADQQKRDQEAEIRRRKEEADRRREEERAAMNDYIGPIGKQEDTEAERLRRIAELNDFAAEQKRLKDEKLAKEAEEREREKELARRLHEQMAAENARLAEETRRQNKQMAKDLADEIKNQKEQAERQRQEEIERERANAARMRELDEAQRREDELNRSNLRNTLRQGYDDDLEAKRVNQELERMISKMNPADDDVNFVEHLTECDRCDVLERPQNLTFLTKDEVEDAAKYIPLKKHRETAGSALSASTSLRPPATSSQSHQ